MSLPLSFKEGLEASCLLMLSTLDVHFSGEGFASLLPIVPFSTLRVLISSSPASLASLPSPSDLLARSCTLAESFKRGNASSNDRTSIAEAVALCPAVAPKAPAVVVAAGAGVSPKVAFVPGAGVAVDPPNENPAPVGAAGVPPKLNPVVAGAGGVFVPPVVGAGEGPVDGAGVPVVEASLGAFEPTLLKPPGAGAALGAADAEGAPKPKPAVAEEGAPPENGFDPAADAAGVEAGPLAAGAAGGAPNVKLLGAGAPVGAGEGAVAPNLNDIVNNAIQIGTLCLVLDWIVELYVRSTDLGCKPITFTFKLITQQMGGQSIALASFFIWFAGAFQPGYIPSRPRGLKATTDDGSINDGRKDKNILVVGAGPVGLATAITLSNPPHSYDVTVLEQVRSPSAFDPTKSYLYVVDGRGQQWTKLFPKVHKKLVERGVQNRDETVLVPPNANDQIVKRVDPSSLQEATYWIERHRMVELLEDAILEQESGDPSKEGSVRILKCHQCQRMRASLNGKIQVDVADSTNPESLSRFSIDTTFVIGTDGFSSAVRDSLVDRNEGKPTWLTMDAKKFEMQSWTSPSSGLRAKMLQLPAKFPISVEGHDDYITENDTKYVMHSTRRGRSTSLSLGFLPVKDPTGVRPASIIARQNHVLWKLKPGSACKHWFLESFPRLQLDQLISDAEWTRFSQAKGTYFPSCQYCKGMQVSHPSGRSAVALLGDAVHAFPPDIGQGINAGFGDIIALDHALRGDKGRLLGDALRKFEHDRLPEIKSLIQLARFGSPYQYRQALWKDKLGRLLWTSNLVLRAALNKLSMGLIPPASIARIQNHRISYRRLMREADLTTINLWLITLFAIWTAIAKMFP